MSEPARGAQEYRARTEEDADGNMTVIVPPPILEALSWCEGDDVEWVSTAEGTVTLRRIARGTGIDHHPV